MSWPDQKYVKFPFVKTTNIQCQNGVGTNGISIGKDAGYNTQGSGAVAIGNFAGQNTQGSGAVAIGVNAGQNTQGANSVAIGSNAGASSQAANSIVISALGTIVTGATANATYIAPIRNIYNNQLLEYNTTTNEITYQPNYFDPSGNLDLSCNLIQDVSGIFFCDGTYIGSGSSFDISTNQVLHISSSQNVLIDASSSVIINRKLGVGTATPAYNLVVSDNTNSLTKLGIQTTSGTIGNFAGIGFGTSGVATNLKSAIGHLCTGASNGIGALIFANNSVTDASPATPSDEKMRITNDGNVGIGTTTPETKLDVVGESIQCSNQGRFKGWYSAGGSGLATEIGTLGGEGYINTYNRTAGVYGNLNLIAGTANMKLTTSGNVGIGTATPTEKLNISGGNLLMGGTFDGMLMNPGSGAASLAITRGGNFINNVQQIIGTPTYTDNVGGSSGGGAQVSLLKNEMSFSTYPNTGTLGALITLTERMRITSTGVGINTTTPGEKLSIEGSGTANENVLRVNNQGNFASRIWLRNSGRSGYFSLGGSASADTLATGILAGSLSMGLVVNSAVQFFNGAVASVKMTILGDGNVGIGTTTPAYPLDVVGSAKMTTIRDTANSVGTSGQVLSSTGSALSWIAPFGSAVLRELTLSTSNSPITFTLGSKSTRELTNIQFNSLGITLSGTPNNTFTIPTAGTYMFRARASYSFSRGVSPAVAGSQLFLHYQNATPSPLTDFIIGEASKSFFVDATANSNNKMNYVAFLVGVGVVGNNAVMSLEQQVNNLSGVSSANGGQFVNVAGQNSIYATIEIQRIG